MADPVARQLGQPRRLILLAVGGIGASAVMTQLALMRELLGAFSGNELVFGISLGSWLLLTGAGAWLGRWLAGGRQSAAAPAPGAPTGDATPSSRRSMRSGDEGVAAPYVGNLFGRNGGNREAALRQLTTVL